MQYIDRSIEDRIVDSLSTFPVVHIAGPRQSGKTTLVKRISESRHRADYITFDDLQIRSAAQHDPDVFLRSLRGNVVLDEIQLVPELFRPLKIVVDENRQSKDGGRGKFLLTGSANVMALPQLSDALAGRMSMHSLLPLSALELKKKRKVSFIDRVFASDVHFDNRFEFDLEQILADATFPELLTISDRGLRREWCNSYLQTVLLRDVHTLLEVQKLASLPNMLSLLATRTGGLLNESSLARDLVLNHITVKKYRILLESLFLTLSVPAWMHNVGTRLVKTPKVYLSDLNLLLHLLHYEPKIIQSVERTQVGKIIENFVAVELAKQGSFATTRTRLYHYRTSSRQEVDFLLESQRGEIVAIEVKSTSRISSKHFRNLGVLKSDLPEKFKCGIVLHLGKNAVQFGDQLYALPLASLWQ